MKYYSYLLCGCLLSSNMLNPFLSQATQKESRALFDYPLNSLQSSLDAFTDGLIKEPESYKKIESIFSIVVAHLSSASQTNSLVAKTLKKKFIHKKTRNFSSGAINHHAIDALLQKLWNKKNRNLTPQAKKVLKRYKEYNAAYYLKKIHGASSSL